MLDFFQLSGRHLVFRVVRTEVDLDFGELLPRAVEVLGEFGEGFALGGSVRGL